MTPSALEEIRKRHEAHRDWMGGDPPRLMAVSQSIEAYQDVAALLAHIGAPPEPATVEEIRAMIVEWHTEHDGLIGSFEADDLAQALLKRWPHIAQQTTAEPEK